MNTSRMKNQIAEEPPRLDARFAVAFYLLTILAGGAVFFTHETLVFAIVTACYLAATALVYDLFQPVSRTLSWFAIVLAASQKFLRRIAEPSPRVHKEVRRTI
jgi:hypothetical protein